MTPAPHRRRGGWEYQVPVPSSGSLTKAISFSRGIISKARFFSAGVTSSFSLRLWFTFGILPRLLSKSACNLLASPSLIARMKIAPIAACKTVHRGLSIFFLSWFLVKSANSAMHLSTAWPNFLRSSLSWPETFGRPGPPGQPFLKRPADILPPCLKILPNA